MEDRHMQVEDVSIKEAAILISRGLTDLMVSCWS